MAINCFMGVNQWTMIMLELGRAHDDQTRLKANIFERFHNSYKRRAVV